LKYRKNLYLSLFEKTYSEASLLSIVYLLRSNINLNIEIFRSTYYIFLLNNAGDDLEIFESNIYKANVRYKIQIVILYLVKIHKSNPKLLNSAYIFHMLVPERRMYDMEGYYMVELFGSNFKECLSEIPTEICSLAEYKNGIVILSLLTMFDEEAIVWDEDMMQFFKKIEEIKLDENLVKKCKEEWITLFNLTKENGLAFKQEWVTYEIMYRLLIEFYQIKLKNYNIEDLDNFDLQYLLELNLIIEEMKLNNSFEGMLECYNIFLIELYKLKIKEKE